MSDPAAAHPARHGLTAAAAWDRRARANWQRWLWVGLALFVAGAAAWGAERVERFPPPEFEPGTYTMPPTTTPPPRAAVMEYVDVTLLLGALSLTTYFVLVKRSRRHVFWVTVFSLVYFGFVRQGCVCPIGSTQDVTLALFSHDYAVPGSIVIFFLAPLLFTLFFGRTFCAAVCPLGAMQEVVLWRPVKVWPWLEQALGLVPYFYLGAAVLFAATGSAFIICEYDPFVSFFRLTGSLQMLAIGAGFLLVGMFVGRPYCRFFCPYGAILSLLSRAARWQVTLAPEDCVRCQICDVACPYGAISDPSEGAPGPAPNFSRARVALYAALLPVLVVGSAFVGRQLAVPFSKMNATVRLAERIAAEDAGQAVDPTQDAAGAAADPATALSRAEEHARLTSKSFRQTGRPTTELHAAALRLRGQFATGGWILGAFVGLVLGTKLLVLSVPERRGIFEPNPANCVACGRCYAYCPKELVRVKKLEKSKASAPSPAAPAA